jgi:predicted PurR-regulated permease PerM
LQDDKEQQQQQASSSGSTADLNPGGNAQQQNQQQPQQPRGQFVQRNLFHFDGSRYISWLPSFSLQLTNGTGVLPSFIGNPNRTPIDPQRLADMVLKLFYFLLLLFFFSSRLNFHL